MTGSWASILFVVLALILPASALLRRRIRIANLWAMALAWAAIFVAAVLIVSFFR